MQGQADEAVDLYEQILDHNPESEEALSNLILIGMAEDDFEMVREFSERLLELRPESTVALEGLATWASAASDHALTAKFCTLLVSAVPGHFEGWFNLGLAYQKSDRWQEAAEAYGEALRLRPHASQANTNLGIVKEELGDTAGAREGRSRKPSAPTSNCWRSTRTKTKPASGWDACTFNGTTPKARPRLSKPVSSAGRTGPTHWPTWPWPPAGQATANAPRRSTKRCSTAIPSP